MISVCANDRDGKESGRPGTGALPGRRVEIADGRHRLPDGAFRLDDDDGVPVRQVSASDRRAQLQLHGAAARVRDDLPRRRRQELADGRERRLGSGSAVSSARRVRTLFHLDDTSPPPSRAKLGYRYQRQLPAESPSVSLLNDSP